MTVKINRLEESASRSLGAFADGRGIHFAVFSEHAERMEVCIFDHNGKNEHAKFDLPDCTNGVWHGYLPGAQAGLVYGYRAYGPYEPKAGLRFNPHKLLLDPYARKLVGKLRWHDALYGYKIGSPRGDLSFDRRDSAAYMPKAMVVTDNFPWDNDRPPRTPWSDTVIYEMHVGGFTRLRDDLPQHDRGTFGALGAASTIDYLRRLGVTAVELLPIHAFADDRHLLDSGLKNYWGYNSLGYFAPHPGYLSDGTLGQIKWAVQQLHAAGIEVILDVVYNHTCEGSELGPTLSWRGLDNSTYYRLLPDEPRYYINDTGCGNTVNSSHQRVIQMTMDSLRYWVEEFHVDGFRFDLGVTLGRETTGFDPGSGFFDALLQDPVLARTKLISEPWDVGPGGHQVGNHPPGFAERNGVFRDDVRRYWRGDDAHRGLFAHRLQGSAELFEHQRRHPWASVNFVTAHDGFTLRDLVSYNHKHNEANAEENRDGSDDNNSCNWGCEGETEDAGILALRQKIMRNFFATLLLSNGTPMLLAGDEIGRTQSGNNNTYCQDNPLSWVDWSLQSDPEWSAMRDFVAHVIAVRKNYPLLRDRYFRDGDTQIAGSLTAVFWFDERGTELEQHDWINGAARVLGLRRAAAAGNEVDVQLLLVNSDAGDHDFNLPKPLVEYRVIIDTADVTAVNNVATSKYPIAAHSLVLLAARVSIDALSAKQAMAANGEHTESAEDNTQRSENTQDLEDSDGAELSSDVAEETADD